VRYVRDIHHPIHMMVLSVASLSFITIAPPARRLCNDTLSTVYPLATRLSYVAPHRTAIVISRSEIRVVPVGGWYTVLSGVEAHMPRRFAIRRASAATGQISPPNASWCTNAPFVPFLVLAIAMVALSALTRVGSPNSRSRSWPLHQRRTSHFLNRMVHFCCCLREAVFANSEEVEECHYHQIRYRCMVRAEVVFSNNCPNG